MLLSNGLHNIYIPLWGIIFNILETIVYNNISTLPINKGGITVTEG